MGECDVMTDKELFERYIELKVALSEYGYTENIINAYLSCTTEICMRYFNDKDFVDREARKELMRDLGVN